eukprot:5554241-Heterocapsa_arctica.AAC.1
MPFPPGPARTSALRLRLHAAPNCRRDCILARYIKTVSLRAASAPTRRPSRPPSPWTSSPVEDPQ